MNDNRRRERMADELKVFISSRDAKCDECGEGLGRSAWITPTRERGALCLSCADLDHLVFLPSGDAALTRRSRKHSTLSAVVLKWSRARKRYERQGLLVEEAALERAEGESLEDAEARERRRERAAMRQAELDQRHIQSFALRVRELYPSCPDEVERVIAEHACLKYSGRVGRSASAKALGEEAIRLAVTAHVRHANTEYDQLLAAGLDRHEARERVLGEVQDALAAWRAPAPA